MKSSKLFKLFLLLSLLFFQTSRVYASEWVELVNNVDSDINAISGKWQQTDEGLLVSAERSARLVLRKAPQGDYDAQISFTRKTGVHSIIFIFSINGKQAGIELDAWGEHLAGIQMIDNLSIKENSTRVNNIRLDNNRKYLLDIKVRGSVIAADLDGESLFELDTSKHQLSVLNLWQFPDKNTIGIGAYDSETVFHSVKLKTVNTDDSIKVSLQDSSTNNGITVKEKPATNISTNKVSKINDDLTFLSDEFNDEATLKNWRRIYREEGSQANQLEQLKINKQGKLELIPYTSSWYQDYRGILVYKEISGDFIATARIRSTGRDGISPPSRQYSLAGIMVRTPRAINLESWQPGGENYIFLSLGAASQPDTMQFEVKTTVNSHSDLEISAARLSEAEIRVIRIGSSFILMKRELDGKWNIHRRYSRADMPDVLQVGMTVYTDWQNVERVPVREHNQRVIKNGNPDLKAQFDYFRFKRPVISEELRSINFNNPAAISDSQLIKLFGD